MRLKRMLSCLLAVLVTAGVLSGCGSSSPAPSSTDTPASSAASESTPADSGKPANGELREVTMVLPRTIEVLEDTPYWVAQNMGYWEEEGIKVNIEQAFGTTDIKMVATGQADFCNPGPNFTLAAIEEGLPVKVVMAYDAINIWGMCVLKDSPVQSFADMQDAQTKYDRKLTVALGDASWEMLVRPTLVAAGIDPDNDLEFVVAGENRYIQVAEKKLDMLFTWPGEAWQLIGQNYNFNYIDGNDVLKTCSNSLITNTKLLEEEPWVVEAFIKGMVKGMYFTQCNQEAAAAVSCDQFPNIDITWKAAVSVQEGRAYQMFGPKGGTEEARLMESIGMPLQDKWELTMQTAVDTGIIKAAIPLDQVYTTEFVPTDWDRAAVEKAADGYDIASAKARYKAE